MCVLNFLPRPVSVADMRAALTSLDPALESAALDHTLGLAFQVSHGQKDTASDQLTKQESATRAYTLLL